MFFQVWAFNLGWVREGFKLQGARIFVCEFVPSSVAAHAAFIHWCCRGPARCIGIFCCHVPVASREKFRTHPFIFAPNHGHCCFSFKASRFHWCLRANSDFFDLANSCAAELQAGLVISNDGSQGVIDDLVSALLCSVAEYLYVMQSTSHPITALASGRHQDVQGWCSCLCRGECVWTWRPQGDLRDFNDLQDLEIVVDKVAAVRIQTMARALSTKPLALWIIEHCMAGVFGIFSHILRCHPVPTQRYADAMMSGVLISSSGGGCRGCSLRCAAMASISASFGLWSSDSLPEQEYVSLGRGRHAVWPFGLLARPRGESLAIPAATSLVWKTQWHFERFPDFFH